MNCPKCKTPMNMTVQIGISCPSEFDGRLTKGMFQKRSVQIEYANWDTASYNCPKCGFHEGKIGTYITNLEDQVKRLEGQLANNND